MATFCAVNYQSTQSSINEADLSRKKNPMDVFCVRGGTRLVGEVNISGAKNAALPILFASLLSEKPIKLLNIPHLRDIEIAINLLNELGVDIKQNGSVLIDASGVSKCRVSSDLASSMRASIWLLAPLLTRFGYAEIPLPGGCAIGERPIDLHIFGLQQLGATIQMNKNRMKVSVNGRLNGARIKFNSTSVGATVTVIIAATLAIGTTIIENAAEEPEIVDTANFLNSIGADIVGAGTKTIEIYGVNRLTGGSYRIIPDRIETGTFLVAAAISRGQIVCRNTRADILTMVLMKLRQAGADISIGDNWIRLNMHGNRPKAIDICTAPYPGFPTDLQSQFSLLNLVAEGNSIVTETIFENRFMHIPQLMRMGARADIIGSSVRCYGSEQLHGSTVMATDLRASASLLIAACIANGITTITHIHHIDRGYENIETKLCKLGANIQRIDQ